MSHDLQRDAIARSIAAALTPFSLSETLVVQVVVQTLEHIRDAGEWERREATGPGDVDRDWHLVRHLRHTVTSPCGGSWAIMDAVEQSDNPPLRERCTACWRAAAASSPGGPALGEALLVVIAEMAERDREVAARQEAARAEMLGPGRRVPTLEETLDRHAGVMRGLAEAELTDRDRPTTVHIGNPGDNWCGEPIAVSEWEIAEQRTRVASDSEVIALGDERARDEEREVELEWGIDRDAGSGT